MMELCTSETLAEVLALQRVKRQSPVCIAFLILYIAD